MPIDPATDGAEAGRSPEPRIQNQSGQETKQDMVVFLLLFFFSCNPDTQRLRQKTCQKFEASLGYVQSSTPTWATVKPYLKQNQNHIQCIFSLLHLFICVCTYMNITPWPCETHQGPEEVSSLLPPCAFSRLSSKHIYPLSHLAGPIFFNIFKVNKEFL